MHLSREYILLSKSDQRREREKEFWREEHHHKNTYEMQMASQFYRNDCWRIFFSLKWERERESQSVYCPYHSLTFFSFAVAFFSLALARENGNELLLGTAFLLRSFARLFVSFFVSLFFFFVWHHHQTRHSKVPTP